MSRLPHGPATDEPIAVIGMSCRLPGAHDPASFWQLLRSGGDAVTDAPADRWPTSAGLDPAPIRRGGFLESVDRFDAAFFGISPHEAAAMDPQQRLVLELAWEALEHARIAPTALDGSATGVYVGAIAADYAAVHDRLDAAAGPHTLTGTQRGLIANRVSYLLGLRGPSLTLDAGQSSSLVAVQVACDELRSGRSPLALVGGVNLNLLPETTDAITRFGALSPDGRCFTFDARANGYVRGEGGAMLVLKPLSAAVADGDPVHAVVLGGAVNNDGGGSGLTVPTERGQADVVRAACRRAGVDPGQVQYVELHGTGTAVGDPIEAAALGASLGAGRAPEAALRVGSVKTNIGHLEGAAGIAGLLKVVLCIAHRTMVASLNFRAAHPRIPLADLRLDVAAGTGPWPRPEHRLIAGVSSFGMGGTNCHLIVAEPPNPPAVPEATEGPAAAPAVPLPPWLLSARSVTALHAQAGALAGHLERHPGLRPEDVALSLVGTRARFEHRAVLLGEDVAARRADLERFADGGAIAATVKPPVVTAAPVDGARCALVFPGQGAQWAGMGRDLLDASPVFRARLTECADALAPYLDYDLLAVLNDLPGAPALDRAGVIQPALWAVMVSLAELWAAHGVLPDLVIGHSQGEIAAATVIGALSLPDAARVVALRSRAVDTVTGGGMLWVAASAAQVQQHLTATAGGGASIAAVNGPRSTVVSGPVPALERMRAAGEAAGWQTRVLPVGYASHSPAVEVLRERLLDELAPIRPVSTDTVFVSTLTGEPMDTAGLDAAYWFQTLRQPVQFAAATRTAIDAGYRVFIDCGPHPVLAGSIEQTADDAEVEAAVVGSLVRHCAGTARFQRSLAEAWVAGVAVDWTGICTRPSARPVDLPTYPFQRDRYWLDGAVAPHAVAPRAVAAARPVTPAAADVGPVESFSRATVNALVADTAAAILGHADGTGIMPTRSFKDLGFDSVSSVDLRTRLAARTGLKLPVTLLFDHPTPGRLGAEILRRLDRRAGSADPTPTLPAAPPSSADDPIAIVAMGCRYPGGVASPEDLWRLVAAGGEAGSDFPVNRGWDLDSLHGVGATPGTSSTRRGGFLHDADQFDAAFFGLSPREALGMDPQQRLVLETVWETFERAGIDPADLTGTATGVFLGAMAADYGPRLHLQGGLADGSLLTGGALSVASGRVAYTFGLQGPALTVDTACSSSLVAIQLATQSLRRGECTLALAGGVSVMSNPGTIVEFSRQNGLATDGVVKAFAEDADGTAFAEGAGMLLLERLSDARRLGHPVLAVVRGGAVNSDGASNGLTAPNGLAQQQVIRQALADAQLSPQDIDVVEAHGTGTVLGDPIEASALLATYGQDRTAETALWLGSVKSNIGHTQAAAGVAGVIKMVMAMGHGLLPRTLHADAATGRVDWDSGQVRLLTETRDWPETGRPRRAGVSSFGISGTNAHVLIEAAPAQNRPAAPAQDGSAAPAQDRAATPTPLTWVLTAKTAVSLRALAARMQSFATTADDAELLAAGPALARRPAFSHRAVIVAGDRAELTAALAELAADRPHAALSTGTARRGIQPVFVFPGQGSEWAGMAADLLSESTVFAAQMARCSEALLPHTGWSATDVLTGADGAPALTGSDVVQPVLFAVMTSLAALWQSIGVAPTAVVGHSQGEMSAAYVAGALSLDEAARLVASRSQIVADADGGSAMMAVPLPVEQVLERIAPWADRLFVAVHNGPTSVVIGGDLTALEEFTARWGDTLRLRRTGPDYASHTPYMAPLRDALLDRIGTLAPTETTTRICAASTGGFVTAAELTPEFWFRNLTGQVRFDAAIRSFADDPGALFVEASPHPILAASVREVLLGGDYAGAVGTLRRGAPGWRSFLRSVGEAFVAGASVDWTRITGPATHHVLLPTYPFDRRRFWLAGADRTSTAPTHPLVDVVLPVAGTDGVLLSTRLTARSTPWLVDHAVAGTVLLPATAYLELALQAADAIGAARIDQLTMHAPVVLPTGGAVELQVRLAAEEDGRHDLTVHSRPAGDPEAGWTTNATGTVSAGHDIAASAASLAQWPPAGATPVDLSDAYGRLADSGYEYGPQFQGLRAAWRVGADLYAEVHLPAEAAGSAGDYAVHPALLDAALHVLLLDGPLVPAAGELLLPFSWSGARVVRGGAAGLRVRCGEAADGVSLSLHDATGVWIGGIDQLSLRRVPAGALAGVTGSGPAGPGHAGSLGPVLHDLDWVPADTAADGSVPDRTWAVVGSGAPAEATRTALRAAGIRVALHHDLWALADMTDAGSPTPPVVLLASLLDPDRADASTGQEAGEGAGMDRARTHLHEMLDTVQQWLGDPRFGSARLVVLADRTACATAPVWGLLRSVLSEHPDRFALLDVEPGAEASWPQTAAALERGDVQLVQRHRTTPAANGSAVPGQVLVPRVRPRTSPAGTSPDLGTGTVLITGGTGGLGRLVAAHLVARHGVRDLLLVSRQGEQAEGAAALVAQLQESGATVRVAACDIADRTALSALLGTVPADRPLVAVLHAAGTVDDVVADRLDLPRLDAVLRPKADGAWLLHELTADIPLQVFVLFSSVAGVLGNAGQANYAAANAVLDSLAAHRRRHSLPAVSIAWGLWAQTTGMTAGLNDADLARLSRSGLAPLSVPDGLALLDAALCEGRTGASLVVASPWDTAALRARAEAGDDVPAVLRGLVRTPVRRAAQRPSGGAGEPPTSVRADRVRDRVLALDRAEARQLLLDTVRARVALVLAHASAEDVHPDLSFIELGLDSLGSVELVKHLSADTGLPLPATLLFDRTDIAGVTDYLVDELRPTAPPVDELLGRVLEGVADQLAEADPAEQRRAVALLQRVLSRLDAGRVDSEFSTDLDSASDEEILHFIDSQL